MLERQSSLGVCLISWQVPDVLVILCRKSESESRRDAGDAQFLRMLHSMDDASISLEAKWDAIAKQMSSKEEFRCASISTIPLQCCTNPDSCSTPRKDADHDLKQGMLPLIAHSGKSTANL